MVDIQSVRKMHLVLSRPNKSYERGGRDFSSTYVVPGLGQAQRGDTLHRLADSSHERYRGHRRRAQIERVSKIVSHGPFSMNDAEPGSDPFQLERLAEELATRELTHDDDDDDELSHDLPVFIPLSHSNPYLTADTFDIEQFLLSRSHTSLQDLRSELRDYLSTLKEELVKLINDDYEAFISLSTDLRGEGVRLGKLKAPLSGLRTEILVCPLDLRSARVDRSIGFKIRTSAHSSSHTTQVGNPRRSARRKGILFREMFGRQLSKQALLHLLLKISESVTRLEGLLLIASPSNDDTEPINGPSLLSTPSTDSQEDK